MLGIINTKNYEYSELFNEINVHTGGIGTSLELYTDVTKVKEKEFCATFEIKGKALYPKMDVLFSMMREILMESDLGDEKRLKEILVNFRYTEDGGASPYDYAKTPLAHDDLKMDINRLDDYELLSTEDILGE